MERRDREKEIGREREKERERQTNNKSVCDREVFQDKGKNKSITTVIRICQVACCNAAIDMRYVAFGTNVAQSAPKLDYLRMCVNESKG